MRVVIVANGNLNHHQEARAAIHPEDMIIAADGGMHHCQALGLIPAVIIGDLDSINNYRMEELESQGIQIISHPRNKDQTDLELAMQYAITLGAQEIYLLGLFGGRLDQTLANLLLLTRNDWKSAHLTAADGPDSAYLLRPDDTFVINGKPNDIVSLIPLSPKAIGVTTKGLRWSLNNATLEFGTTLGISNEMVGDVANVCVGYGNLLVVHRANKDSDPHDLRGET